MHLTRWSFIALVLAGTACEKPAPPATPQTAAQSAAQTAAQAEAKPADAAPTEPVWEGVAADALTDAEKALVERGTKAQQSLGSQLVGALTQSVQRDGFAASIEFCRGEAPDVAQKIATEHSVKIGRTSHKLRNPTNTAPAWAAPAVAAATGGQQFFRSATGAIGMLSPIMTAELCVNCHGPAEKLAEGVADAVAKAYPNDQATGFAPGELRGWIWVEVQ